MEKKTLTSIALSRFLDYMELSKDHIESKVSRIRRLEMLANSVDFRPDFLQTLITGSTADGIGWKGYNSDIDTMVLIPYVSVVEAAQRTEHLRGFILEMSDNGVHDGYVRLKLKSEDHELYDNMFSMTPGGIKAFCVKDGNDFFMSSYQLKRCFMRSQQAQIKPAWVMQTTYSYNREWPDEEQVLEHGPSVCVEDKGKHEGTSDLVPCFRCPFWPKQAMEWRDRARNWPPQEIVNDLVSQGIKVVAVGFIGSEMRHLEWRLSFGLSERELISHMNNTQHKCYSLLKMMLKEVLLKDDEAGVKQLNSYHMKNTLFWSIENSDPTVWCPERITEAFQICLDKLYSWLKCGQSPSYFIRSNNVFEGKVEGDDLVMFSKLLEPYAGTDHGWKILLHCDSLSTQNDFARALEECEKTNNPYLNISQFPMPDIGEVWFEHDVSLFPRYEDARVEILAKINAGNDTMLAITQHYDLLKDLAQRQPENIYRTTMQRLVCAVEASLGSHLHDLALREEATDQTRLLHLALMHLKKGTESDASSGKLRLANFHYMNKNYTRCVKLVAEVLSTDHLLPSYVQQLMPSLNNPAQRQLQKYKEFVKANNHLKTEERFLSAASQAVIFMPSELNAVPAAVKHQLRKALPEPYDYAHWLSWAVYDSTIYALFLRFLCHLQAHEDEQAMASLNAMETSLNKGDVAYEASCLNVLGHAYLSLNQLDRAVEFLLKAAQKDFVPNSDVSQLVASLHITMKSHPLRE